jgi:hypothetical protein
MDGISAVSVAAASQVIAVTAATQEATETAAVTKQEAAKGDQQAIRKLARMQQQNAPAPVEAAAEIQKSAPPSASPEGVGKLANVFA